VGKGGRRDGGGSNGDNCVGLKDDPDADETLRPDLGNLAFLNEDKVSVSEASLEHMGGGDGGL
jgi:hypothetical protein